ncbi:unnamed protein product [Somion occarium]|uniref:Telomere-associated protein Rif1 N-terminal domain-containing protein n=1 Tax=Somion occarium TaxID=3059160 RepID=A0ABP1DZ02_9APHY
MIPYAESRSSASTQDPLSLSTYFRSPVCTLVASLEDEYHEVVSFHDVCQAYDLLCLRIQRIAEALLTHVNPVPPVLTCLQKYSSSIARCLRRDINCAFTYPLTDPPRPNRQIPDSVPLLFHNPPDDEVKVAEDASAICQHAIRLASIMFKFPALFNLFSDYDLSSVFSEILRITLSSSVPTPGEAKIRSLAMWAISEQELPTIIAKDRKSQLLSLLHKVLLGSNKLMKDTQTLSDALKLIHRLLYKHPLIFLEPLANLLESVLAQLVFPHPMVRVAAAHALGGYTLAVTTCSRSIPSSLLSRIADQISTSAQSQLKPRKLKIPSTTKTLLSYFCQITSSAEPDNCLSDAFWAYSILASFIVLSDGRIFCIPRMLKAVIDSMSGLHKHFGRGVSQTHLAVWRCLIWALLRLRHHIDEQQSKSNAEASTAQTGVSSKWTPALDFVRQDLEFGNGSALICYLMNQCPTATTEDVPDYNDIFVTSTLKVLDTMINHSHREVRNDAIAFLARLTCGLSSPHSTEWEDARIVSHALLSGSALYGYLENTSCFAVDADPRHIRPLSENEVVAHWGDLLVIWKTAMGCKIVAGEPVLLSTDLSNAWHDLLLAQSHLTQQDIHLAASPALIEDTITIISDLLATPKEHDARVMLQKVQASQLKTIHHLWIVTKHVVGSDSQGDTAAAILSSVLEREFALDDGEVKTSWSELCCELMIAQNPHLLASLQATSESQGEKEVRSRLWQIVAETYVDVEQTGDHNWERIAKLLLIPLGHSTLSEDECKLWARLLDHALQVAEHMHIYSPNALDYLVQNAVSADLFISPEVVTMLLSRLKLNEENDLPLSLFKHTNDTLCALYPPEGSPSPVLELFHALTNFLKTIALSHLVPTILQLTQGLITWIHNDCEGLDVLVFNNDIIPLYCTALERLATIPLTVSLLQHLSPFLCSAFEFIPFPGLAVRAFQPFWKTVGSGIANVDNVCPAELKTCVEAFCNVTDQNLPAGYFSDSQSQSRLSMSQSSVPDSQPAASDNNDPEYAYFLNMRSSRDNVLPGERHPSPATPIQQRMSSKNGSAALPSTASSSVFSPEVPAPSSLQTTGMSDLPRRVPMPQPTSSDVYWPSIPGLSCSTNLPSSPLIGLLAKKRQLGVDIPPSSGRHDNIAESDVRSEVDKEVESRDLHQAKRARETRESFNPMGTQKSEEIPVLNDQDKLGLSPDDYDTWEASVPSPEVRRIRNELTSGDTSDSAGLRRHVDRSQSVPLATGPRVQAPLRRAQTNSSQLQGSSRLQALHQAYHALREAGPELPMDEAAEALKLLHEMNGLVQQKMFTNISRQGSEDHA